MSDRFRLDEHKLRELRDALGLSQVELAKRAGVTQATLSRTERGFPTTYYTANKIANVLGVDVTWLLEKMPGDVRRGPDDLLHAWLNLIQGKTRELRERIEAGDLPMAKVAEIDELHQDIERYAGPRLGLERGDSKIALALDEMRSVVVEAYEARLDTRPNPEAAVAQAIDEAVKEEGARKTA